MIYLASQSPRRKELLKQLKVPFKVVRSRYRERNHEELSPAELVLKHACGKAKKAIVPNRARWILGADTVVGCAGKILGKPKSRKQALRMISLISGRSQTVYTGVVLWDRQKDTLHTGVEKTQVFLNRLSREAIQRYLEEADPLDKAGGLAIEEIPGCARRIKGSYSNVLGLPIELVKKLLQRLE